MSFAPQPSGAQSATPLPPGQNPAALRRFGLPQFARVRPVVSARPTVSIGGAVARPTLVTVAELLDPRHRRDQRSDLHCVTTWSACGLRWEGVPFHCVHRAVAERVGVAASAAWVSVAGLDGYRACLPLADLLAEDVLLADRLNGAPLDADHGAPLRLVAPGHYGYKSVKHVCAIEYRLRYEAGPARWAGHPRGRPEREERSRFLPGRLWRPIWRAARPAVQRRYDRF